MLCRWPVDRTQPHSRCRASNAGAEHVLRARFFRLGPGLVSLLPTDCTGSPTQSVWRFHVPRIWNRSINVCKFPVKRKTQNMVDVYVLCLFVVVLFPPNRRRFNAFHFFPSRAALLTSSIQFSLRGIDKERLTVFSARAGGTMAEVGLLPLARVALQVATQVLPPYRSRFSKQQFTQPPLLAVLCLMRYEDCTFREAEVRLPEHHALRAVLQLPAVPDYTTRYRFLRPLEDDTVDRGLQETVRRLRRRRRRPVSAAIDGTGLSHTSVSTFFLRRLEQHAHGAQPRRPWLKWLIVVDVQQQILLAQRARQGPGCDARALPGLLDVAARGAPLGVVLADAEFDSEANHQHIRQRLGAKSIIPARRRGVPNGTIRNQMFRAFPKKPYRQRAKIESIFSAVKRKLSSRAPGRSLTTQIRQALLCARLRASNIDASAGSVEELKRIVEQIRSAWPLVRMVVRGDSGFCREELMAWCEANR